MRLPPDPAFGDGSVPFGKADAGEGADEEPGPSPSEPRGAAPPPDAETGDDGPLTLSVSAKEIGLTLGAVVVALHVANAVAQYIHLHIGEFGWRDTIVDLFRVNDEGKLPTWYSTITLTACAVLAAAIALAAARRRGRTVLGWSGLAVIFAAMSLNELAELHSTVGGPLQEVTDAGERLPEYGWVVNGAAFVAVFALVYARFVIRLPEPTRRLLVLGGAIYVAGALGLEIVGGLVREHLDDDGHAYALTASVEEVLEMTGIVLVVCALWLHLGRVSRGIDLRFG